MVVTLILGTGFGVAPRTAKADIIYAIQNYPADQAGHTLSGQITTDGTLGALSASAIKSWTFTISNVGTFSGGGSTVTINGMVKATATQITVDDPPQPTTNTDIENSFQLRSGSAGLLYTQAWDHINPIPPPILFTHLHEFDAVDSMGKPIWNNPFNAVLNGSQPWVIAVAAGAAVPEPSTAILALVGSVAVIAYRWSRHRRTLRRQGAG
jgi:hypothetical protein